jgi:hypothetical protein
MYGIHSGKVSLQINENIFSMNKSYNSLTDQPVNIKIKLALLWATIMALYIYADFFNLMTPDTLQTMMDLQTPVGPTTPGVLVSFSILLIIPAMMITASVFLKPQLNRWLNVIFGFIYALVSVLIFVTEISLEWQTFFVLYQAVEIFVFAIIIYNAWSWPRQEGAQNLI